MSATMQFFRQNYVNTTGTILADSGSGTLEYLFDRNLDLGYVSQNYDSNTSTVISIEFDTPTIISHIFLQNHNLKQFRIFFNSATANTLTPDINKTTNSDTSNYFAFASQTVNSIQLQMDTTIAGGEEKKVGELVITELLAQFEQNPNSANYNPSVENIREKHTMPDGGIITFQKSKKFSANIKLKFITDTFANTLLEIYDDGEPCYFVPFPTATAWDNTAYEVVWTNSYDFRHDDNSKTQGKSGTIVLEETSAG